MKKFLSIVALAMMTMFCMTSCSSDEDEADIRTLTFEGDYFSALIDSPQYGGALIYSNDTYVWNDATTTISSSCEKADWTQWGMGYGWDHGIAISNYVDATASSYDKQLSVPVSNGSKNFAIVWDDNSELKFADGKAHFIESMDVCNTSYALANITKNNGSGYYFKVIATGTKADGTTSSIDIMLAEGTTAISTWQTVNLRALGAVTKVVFTFDGSDKSEYGVSTPKYFALDNVVVEY